VFLKSCGIFSSKKFDLKQRTTAKSRDNK